jgi:hypothetical protein
MTKTSLSIHILQAALFLVAVLMGLDKFINVFEKDWTHYLSPAALAYLHDHGKLFMKFAGVFEVIVGVGVIFKPKVFAFVLSLWLFLIVINLLMSGHSYDDAVRDSGLCLAAFALGILSLEYE